jgi:hypothetical protein
MNKLIAVLVIAALAPGCSASTRRHVNHITGAAAVIGLAIDYCQTANAASHEWMGTSGEVGYPTQPMIGSHPSERAVGVYFAASTVVIIGVAQLVPEKYRGLLYGAVVGVEAATIHGNLASTSCMGVGHQL